MQGVAASGSADLVDVGSASNGTLNDAVDALMVLGYSRAEALEALRGSDIKMPTEDLIKLALKKLMRG